MFIYVGRNFTSTVSGSVIRQIKCEKCQSDYCYELIRGASATASAPYYIGQRSAAKRAERNARKALEKLLKNEIDPVFCPKCGWFQSPMVRELRRRKHAWLKWIAICIGFITPAVVFITWANQTRGFDRELHPDQRNVDLVIALIGFALTAAIVVIRRSLQNASDPNNQYPATPAPIPGAPRGILLDEFLAAGGNLAEAKIVTDPNALASPNSGATLNYEQRPPVMDGRGWITVQIRRIPALRVCCACLNPTDTGSRIEIGQATTVYTPICPQCIRRLKRTRLYHGLIGAAAAIAITAIFGLIAFDNRRDGPGPIIALSIFAGIVGAVIGVTVAQQRTAPVRYRGYSVRLNTVKVLFRNSAFRNIFIDASTALESAPPVPPAAPQRIEIPRPARPT